MTTTASTGREPVLFYSKSTCPWANAVRLLLTQNGVAFEERAIDKDPAHLEELRRTTGQVEQPSVKIGEEWLLDTDAKVVAKRLGLPEPEHVRVRL